MCLYFLVVCVFVQLATALKCGIMRPVGDSEWLLIGYGTDMTEPSINMSLLNQRSLTQVISG